jgi:hypothetical protein
MASLDPHSRDYGLEAAAAAGHNPTVDPYLRGAGSDTTQQQDHSSSLEESNDTLASLGHYHHLHHHHHHHHHRVHFDAGEEAANEGKV